MRALIQAARTMADCFHIAESMREGTSFAGSVAYAVPGAALLEQPVPAEASWILHPTLTHIQEALNVGVSLIVTDLQRLPLQDKKTALHLAKEASCLIVEGYMRPGKCRLGYMPRSLYRPGSLGIIASSPSLGLEAALEATEEGIGQSLVIHRGEMSVADLMPLFGKSTVRIIEG